MKLDVRCSNKQSGFRRVSVRLTAENVRVDKRHPRCVVCGRRLDHAGRSEVMNVCVECRERMSS